MFTKYWISKKTFIIKSQLKEKSIQWIKKKRDIDLTLKSVDFFIYKWINFNSLNQELYIFPLLSILFHLNIHNHNLLLICVCHMIFQIISRIFNLPCWLIELNRFLFYASLPLNLKIFLKKIYQISNKVYNFFLF